MRARVWFLGEGHTALLGLSFFLDFFFFFFFCLTSVWSEITTGSVLAKACASNIRLSCYFCLGMGVI